MASHLKAAGKAILNSPKALRRKLAGGNDESHHDSEFRRVATVEHVEPVPSACSAGL